MTLLRYFELKILLEPLGSYITVSADVRSGQHPVVTDTYPRISALPARCRGISDIEQAKRFHRDHSRYLSGLHLNQ
jgi:hypothetical protein